MTQPQVMIVDDAEDNRLVLSSLLESHYQITEAVSGEECLQLLSNSLPDLILLDISMPGISGYDTCVSIRKDPQTASLPIIFVSAKDSPEERLAGFEAGANDYITKPIDGRTLLDKVQHYIRLSIDKKDALNQSREAMNVAMEAMTSSSELGQIIQFVKEVQSISKAPSLAASVMTVASQFGLNSSVLITGPKPVLMGCSNDSLEARLMEKFRTAEQRITHLGVRTVIRSSPVILLIKNMPAGDEARYGRLKDHLAVLADIAADRAKSILADAMMEEQRVQFLKEVIVLAELNIDKTSKEIQDYSDTVTRTMSNMLSELEGMLFSLGLDDDQEKKLMALANSTTDKLEETSQRTVELDAKLSNILEALYELMENQNH